VGRKFLEKHHLKKRVKCKNRKCKYTKVKNANKCRVPENHILHSEVQLFSGLLYLKIQREQMGPSLPSISSFNGYQIAKKIARIGSLIFEVT
jgi:hypothetical protein